MTNTMKQENIKPIVATVFQVEDDVNPTEYIDAAISIYSDAISEVKAVWAERPMAVNPSLDKFWQTYVADFHLTRQPIADQTPHIKYTVDWQLAMPMIEFPNGSTVVSHVADVPFHWEGLTSFLDIVDKLMQTVVDKLQETIDELKNEPAIHQD